MKKYIVTMEYINVYEELKVKKLKVTAINVYDASMKALNYLIENNIKHVGDVVLSVVNEKLLDRYQKFLNVNNKSIYKNWNNIILN